ncbi:MAG: guanine deaminase [Rhodobacterales bacterium]|nr:guanine deaminase [Rhodobacterales bacterium]
MPVLRARVCTPKNSTTVRWIPDAIVVIEEGRITELGPFDGRPIDEDLRPSVLLPGFVDAHIHFPQTRIVGSATGPLLEWLDRATFPEEARFADPQHAARVARVFAANLASAGTTSSLVYSSVHPQAAHAVFQALSDRGLRARVGPVLMDIRCPDELMLPADRALPALAELADTWHGHNDLLEVAVIPRFALCCTEQMMTGAGQLAQDRNLWVSTHLSETQIECQIACDLFDAPDYLSIYERVGMVHERSVYAHCIHLSDSEWDRMAAAKAVVAHCPDSNDFLGSGGMPVRAVQDRNIPLAVGTDIAAGRSFRLPQILSSAYDNGLRQGHTLNPRTLLWWGTRGGAQSLGWDTGAIEVGLDADLIAVDVPPWAETEEQVLAAILFDKDAPLVRKTWVRGEQVWDRDTEIHPWNSWETP